MQVIMIRVVPVVLFYLFNFQCSIAQNKPDTFACDKDLLELSKELPSRYMWRVNRCEGQYEKQVDRPSLKIISFTSDNSSWNPKLTDSLQINWNSFPFSSMIFLRGDGTRENLYYRMDTSLPVEENKFFWSTDILSRLNLIQSDLGLTGRVNVLLGDKFTDMYIPVSVGYLDDKINDWEFYSLSLMPGDTLKEVVYNLHALNWDGEITSTIVANKKIESSYYPAGHTFNILIDELEQNGIYKLEVFAEIENRGLTSKKFTFYHSID